MSKDATAPLPSNPKTALCVPLSGLGFNGQWREPVTGCYLLGNGHRSYSPTLMRFCCPDRLSPFGAGGINAYAYCVGDPVNRSDPSGKASIGVLVKVSVFIQRLKWKRAQSRGTNGLIEIIPGGTQAHDPMRTDGKPVARVQPLRRPAEGLATLPTPRAESPLSQPSRPASPASYDSDSSGRSVTPEPRHELMPYHVRSQIRSGSDHAYFDPTARR